MNPDRWQQIKQLYSSALEVAPNHREAFLEKACAGDESLRDEIGRLLARQAEADNLLESPAFEVAARALAPELKDKPAPDYVGRSLLHYRITEKIGEGGMGIVYKAHDSHLGRTVAIKVLPAGATTDPQRKGRFVQEARAASALNHPNIIGIHDISSDGGVFFIAMEHVTGETLDRRIGRKKLSISEALKYAVQLADALAAAHASGIVHRDLKPANIMVTDAGRIKVLDFGLAKLTQPFRIEASGCSEFVTECGRIMGTVAYMSPEQAEGKAVDARSDIFSFGSVLYEMIEGKPAFRRDSKTSTLSAIIEEDPPPMSTDIPTDLGEIVTRCLRKDPARRYQTSEDVKAKLQQIEASELRRPPAEPAQGMLHSAIRLSLLFAAIAALIAAGWYYLGRRPSADPGPAPVSVPLTSYPGFEWFPSFSPDGTQVAFEWCKDGPELNCDIYVKQIGVEPPFRLTGDPEVDCCPAWSPDGSLIAFLRLASPTRALVLAIPQREGQERVLGETDLTNLMPPYLDWTPDSKWLVLPDSRGPGLYLLSVQSGQRRRLTDRDDSRPSFSPDGRRLVYTHGYTEMSLLHLGGDYMPQGTPERLTPVGEDWVGITWAPDGNEIIFSQGTWAGSSLWRMAPLASASPRRLPFATENSCYPAVSRHGNRLACAVNTYDFNIWRVDSGTAGSGWRSPGKLISSTRQEMCPSYSPDGGRIAFISDRSGVYQLWVCDADGSNAMQLTSGGAVDNGPRWSPDGRTIAYTESDGKSQFLNFISAVGGTSRRLVTDPVIEIKWPSWSRDGQSIYFDSWRDGENQIWKVPSAGGKAVQVSRAGVWRGMPQESPDGEFLYYMRYNQVHGSYDSVWKVPVSGGEEIRVIESIHPAGGYRVCDKGIYYFRMRDGPVNRSDLCLYEFLTGRTTKILSVEGILNLYVEASVDGRSIIYTHADRADSDLLLVENFRCDRM